MCVFFIFQYRLLVRYLNVNRFFSFVFTVTLQMPEYLPEDFSEETSDKVGAHLIDSENSHGEKGANNQNLGKVIKQ